MIGTGFAERGLEVTIEAPLKTRGTVDILVQAKIGP